MREEDPERADHILSGFQSWKIDDAGEGIQALLKHLTAGSKTDCLKGGRAGQAAVLLSEAEEVTQKKEKLIEAGRILKDMTILKKERGCYRVFPAGRHSYFLPAFLLGNAGIAYILLRYAEFVSEQ